MIYENKIYAIYSTADNVLACERNNRGRDKARPEKKPRSNDIEIGVPA